MGRRARHDRFFPTFGIILAQTSLRRQLFKVSNIRNGISCTSIRRPRSDRRGLIQGKRASTWKSRPLCTDSPRAQIALFLFVSFACQCRSSVLLHVLVPRGRSARSLRIMEADDKRKAPKAKWNTNKRRSKMKKKTKKTPGHLRLRRRRGRVSSENSSNHPPFCFRRQLPSKKKEMSCYRFRERDCKCTWSIIHRLGTPFWSPWKQWQKRSGYHVHTQKRSGSEISVFERSTFGSVFEKLRFGARAFPKSSGYVRIRVTVSMYPGSKSSVFEKTRVCFQVQWIPFVLRKTLFDFIKSCGSQIRLKFSKVALLGILYSPK